MEAIELHDAAGAEDHRRRRARKRVHVKERQRRDQPLFAVAQRAKAAFVDIALADVEEIEVAEETSLRLAGGTGRIEERAFVAVTRWRRLRRIEMRQACRIDDK